MDRRRLTEREIAVTRLVADGRTNAEIAETLSVSLATVKRHLNNVMIKWNCDNRTQVAVRAVRLQERPPPNGQRVGPTQSSAPPAGSGAAPAPGSARPAERVAPPS